MSVVEEVCKVVLMVSATAMLSTVMLTIGVVAVMAANVYRKRHNYRYQ